MLVSGRSCPDRSVAGLLIAEWFNRLKNSALNCITAFSWIPPTRVVLPSVASKLNWPGPRIGPIPMLP